MKPKTMILMVVAVVCGLGASYMTSKLLAERNKPDNEPTVTVLVVKPKERVNSWQPIKEPEKYFEVKQYPVSVAPPNALDSFEAIRDQMLNKPLEEGKVITKADLLTKEQRSMAENLKPGQRAIAIKVNPESLVGGFVLPNTRVDVICTTRGNDASARIILQNMQVLAVDTQDTRTDTTKTIIGQTVTLAATAEEAVRLSLAQSTGELRLLLKNTNDSKRTETVVARTADLAKPLHGDLPEESETRSAPKTVVNLPAVTEDPKQPEPVPVVKKEEPRKSKRHVMTIANGTNVDKAVFILGRQDDDEDTPPSSTVKTDVSKEEKPKSEPKTEPKKPEPPKVAPPAAPPPAAPPSAFGKSSLRTGRIN
jgi:pilus assembly protein CpaB